MKMTLTFMTNLITYCVSNSVSPIVNNQFITNINIKTNNIMTRTEIKGLFCFCKRKFGTTDVPFTTLMNAAIQEANDSMLCIYDFLMLEYIYYREMNEEQQYLEQQEEQEREQDYIDNWWEWEKKYRE